MGPKKGTKIFLSPTEIQKKATKVPAAAVKGKPKPSAATAAGGRSKSKAAGAAASGSHPEKKGKAAPASQKAAAAATPKKKALTPMEVFGQEINDLEARTGKRALVLGPLDPKEDDDEDEEEEEEKMASIEELRALPKLLLDKATMDRVDAITVKMSLIGRESEDDPFRMTTTKDSYEVLDLIQEVVKEANKTLKKEGEGAKAAFGSALGILLAVISDDFWLMDNDVPDDVAKQLSNVRKLWTALLKLPPAQLGVDASTVAVVEKLIKKSSDKCKGYGYKF